MRAKAGLAVLDPLTGGWNVQMTFPDRVLKGSATFEWFQPSGFVLMRSHTIYSDIPPKASAVIGFDDASGTRSPASQVKLQYERCAEPRGFLDKLLGDFRPSV